MRGALVACFKGHGSPDRGATERFAPGSPEAVAFELNLEGLVEIR